MENLPNTTEEIKAKIATQQAELKRLHAQKRLVEAREQQMALERHRSEAAEQNVNQAITTAPTPGTLPDPGAGLPTPRGQIDLNQSQEVPLDATLDPDTQPKQPSQPQPRPSHKRQHPTSEASFGQGAFASFANIRGPLIVDFTKK